MDILDAIGNTSLVRLRKVVPPNCADIFAKLESENPTGSMKDRMAQAVISRAEQDGRLKPGDTVVEYTGGSTGPALALVCRAKGYRCLIVMADCFTEERFQLVRALGAELDVVKSVEAITERSRLRRVRRYGSNRPERVVALPCFLFVATKAPCGTYLESANEPAKVRAAKQFDKSAVASRPQRDRQP